MTLPFTKVEGIGNDFLVVDLRPGRPGAGREGPSPEDPASVRALCDRNFGVGGDGVLAILPSTVADARMRVLNADGSEAEMCGNGIRCVAKVLHDSDPALRRPRLRIETGAGVLECEVAAPRGVAEEITVDMGRPRLTREEIPLSPAGPGRALRETISVAGRTFRFTGVSMGNPHAVFLGEEGDLRQLAEQFGPTLEVADRFPKRTNVELARVRGGEIDLVVWERGCGITLACGTGACATVVAACLEERLAPGVPTPVHLPGGPLVITVAEDYSGVRMRGPARTVFEGSVDLAALLSR
jgi:diaminopimelate epimerase